MRATSLELCTGNFTTHCKCNGQGQNDAILWIRIFPVPLPGFRLESHGRARFGQDAVDGRARGFSLPRNAHLRCYLPGTMLSLGMALATGITRRRTANDSETGHASLYPGLFATHNPSVSSFHTSLYAASVAGSAHSAA